MIGSFNIPIANHGIKPSSDVVADFLCAVRAPRPPEGRDLTPPTLRATRKPLTLQPSYKQSALDLPATDLRLLVIMERRET
jgi:hypothetical protein